MLDFIGWMLKIVFQFGLLYLGVMAIKYMRREGRHALKDVAKTVSIAIKNWCLKIQKKQYAEYISNLEERKKMSEQDAMFKEYVASEGSVD